jgi:tripartite-type tricarboxylate transporter receptor subunit TctC
MRTPEAGHWRGLSRIHKLTVCVEPDGNHPMRGLFLLAALAAGWQWIASAAAQPYPSRPIRLVVASSAGGVHDVIGRLWADKLKTSLGAIVIDNRGGAGGSIGVAEVVRAQPDGYTLLLGSNGTHILHPLVSRQPAYDAVNDFEVISVFATTSTAVAVHPSAPAPTLRDLVDYAKAHPGKLSYAHGGVGGPSHTAAEMFKRLAGELDIVPIPYKGMGPAQADVIAGTVPMFVPNITGQVIELHRSGRIRILSVNAPARHEALPDIPTAIEAGVAGMVSQNFFGIFAPAGTPKPIVAQIDRLTQAALAEKEFHKRLGDAGFEPMPGTGGDAAKAYIKSEYARWKPIIDASGAKTD